MSLKDEVHPLPECLAGLSAQGEAEKEVVAVVRAIESQAAEAVRDLALAELELPAGAEAVTSKLIPLLEWSRLSYDKADDQVLPRGCRHPGVEPVPPIIDNRARGAVPCKQTYRLLCVPPSPCPRSSQDEEAPHAEGGGGSNNLAATTQEIDTHAAERRGTGGERSKGTTHRGVPSGTTGGTHREIDNHNGGGGHDQGDGRTWPDGEGGEDGEIMELLTKLSDGDPHGGEEVLAGAGGIGDAIARGRRQEERIFLEGLRRRKEARQRELADARDRLERADKEAKEKEERMMKELKGREWVWGPDGEVLVLDVTPPEKIPGRVIPRIGVRDCVAPSTAGAGCSVGTDAAPSSWKPHSGAAESVQTLGGGGNSEASKGRPQDEPVKEGVGGGSGSAGGAAGGAKEGGVQKAGRGRRPARNGGAAARRKRESRSEQEQRFFEVSATTQPPLVDSLDLQAGVCVKEGSDERQGPAFEEDRKHFSRREPSTREPLLKELPLPLAVGSVSDDGETSSVRARGGRSLDPQPDRRRPSHGDPLSPPATYPTRSASIGSRPGRDKRGSPGRGSLVDRVKTFDPLSGAMRLEPVGVGTRESGGRHRGRRLVVPGEVEPEGFGVGVDDDAENDPHWRLFKEGGNVGGGAGGGRGFTPVPPPPLPRKRRSRQRPGVLAKPELRRPRDRGTRLPIPTVARKHLPPPPVGETMGHGLSPSRDRGPGGSASGFGNDAGGGPSPPGSHLSHHDNSRSVAGRKRRGRGSGSGDGGEDGGENARNTLPRKGGVGGRGRGGENEFPALPLSGQHRQQDFRSPPPVKEDGGVMSGEGGGGGAGGGGGRKGRRRGSGSVTRMGWVRAQRSQGSLQELLRATS
eukprot:g8256.t1